MNSMTPPKLLPWIARKAGITDELALKLWRRAASDAENELGSAAGSVFWAHAVELFRGLVEAEAAVQSPATQLGWVWRHQQRIAMHTLTVSQVLYQWGENLRRRFQGRCPTLP
jgi:hypothetical protein